MPEGGMWVATIVTADDVVLHVECHTLAELELLCDRTPGQQWEVREVPVDWECDRRDGCRGTWARARMN